MLFRSSLIYDIRRVKLVGLMQIQYTLGSGIIICISLLGTNNPFRMYNVTTWWCTDPLFYTCLICCFFDSALRDIDKLGGRFFRQTYIIV